MHAPSSDSVRASAVHSYDGMNRPRWIDHPAGSSDVGFTYAADGALLTAATCHWRA